jgi:hypothetical protein
MDRDDVESPLEDGEYTAVRKGDEYTISGRDVPIGRMERKEGRWVAIPTTLTVEKPAEPVWGDEPRQVLHDFLRRGGYLPPE